MVSTPEEALFSLVGQLDVEMDVAQNNDVEMDLDVPEPKTKITLPHTRKRKKR